MNFIKLLTWRDLNEFQAQQIERNSTKHFLFIFAEKSSSAIKMKQEQTIDDIKVIMKSCVIAIY